MNVTLRFIFRLSGSWRRIAGLMDDESERIWKEAVIDHYKAFVWD
jgi:hypothetical protein